jgi:hypothetical protein
VIYCHPRALGEGRSRLAIFVIVEGTMLKNKFETGREFDSATARHFTSWVRSYARLSHLRTDSLYSLSHVECSLTLS